MLGPLFVFSLLAFVCAASVVRPAIGLIGMYGFLLLDPQWNWRWSLPANFGYQKYIFASLAIGFLLSGFRSQPLSRMSKFGIFSGAVFFSLCWLSTQQSVSPADSEFFMSIMWKQFLVLLLGVFVLDSPKKLRALLIVAALAQGYSAYQINLDYFQTGFMRYAYTDWGTTGADNNGYSIITLPILAISFSLALFETGFWRRCLFFGIAVLQAHQIMLMQSRGCMVAGMGMLAVLVWYMPRTKSNMVTLAMALLAGVILAGPSVVEEFSSSFASEGERDSSAESRFYLWQAGVRITRDYPLLGVGPNAARRLVPLPEYYEGGLDQNNKALHNLFFDVSTGVGIPGFLAYFPLLILPLVHAWRHYDPNDRELGAVRLAVFGGILGYLAASMFSSGLLFESCYILSVTGFCCSNLAHQARTNLAAFGHAPAMQPLTGVPAHPLTSGAGSRG